MHIGVPKEIKNNEYRVGLTPAGVKELCNRGHYVMVEQNCGAGIGVSDAQYREAGAQILHSPEEIFREAELIVKVKEPQPGECRMLRPGQTLFTYLHLAPDPVQTQLLLKSGATCIAYETISDGRGGLPLLAPMSEVAGRLAAQEAAHCLEKVKHGSGVLMGGVPGVAPANVLVIGGGVVGLNAARIASGMGASVTIADRSLDRLKEIDELYHGRITTLYASSDSIEKLLPVSDAVIGAVLVPGAAAPKLLTRDMLKLMRKGSVLVDVAIDQGGCFETSRPTTHENPTYEVDGIVHYCVANMPGAVPRTSTFALTNATLPYVVALAENGVHQSLLDNSLFMNGLNLHKGMVTYEPVAKALKLDFVEQERALRSDFMEATA